MQQFNQDLKNFSVECGLPEESNNSVIDILDLSQGAYFSHGGCCVYLLPEFIFIKISRILFLPPSQFPLNT